MIGCKAFLLGLLTVYTVVSELNHVVQKKSSVYVKTQTSAKLTKSYINLVTQM